jgi:oxygen-independent coproporphyrinogen-3 oxidase
LSGSSTLGIYVQVPFCRTKCSYCNFHTGPFVRNLYAPYAQALRREMMLARAAGGAWLELPVNTVYVGGGTPSLLEPAELASVMDALRANFRCAWREATLEADPETITREKADAWRAAGIDRISLGCQSFHDAELRAAGRLHRREDIFAAIAALRAAGVDNVSADLIAGLPLQTRAS